MRVQTYIDVIGVGALTSVGLNAVQTAASIRAGISGIRDTEWTGKDMNPYRGGFLPEDCLEVLHRKTFRIIPDSLPARLLQLGSPALREAVGWLSAYDTIPPVIVGIGDRAQIHDLSAEVFLENLMRQSRVRLDIAQSEVVFLGRTAGLHAIKHGCRLLLEGYRGPIIAGGIDSYFDYSSLVDLDFDSRVLNDMNLDGFLPGEGAGFVLLYKSTLMPNEMQSLCTIAATSNGFQSIQLDSPKPANDRGISETLSSLFQTISHDLLPCKTVFANLNGENIGAKEWGIAFHRNQEYFSEDFHLIHPAECIGETGAAMGPIMVGLAIRGMMRGYHSAPILIECSSDDGECVALYLKLKHSND